MSSDPFKLPGNDHQKNFDEMFAKPKSGGGGGGGNTARRHAEEKAQKELDQEFEEAHKQEAKKEPAEENPKQKPVVKISNGKWHHEKGQFNKKATAKVDVQLPDSHKDLTRIVFTLHSIDKYGKKLRVDSKEAHVKHGIAEIEFTLYRASQRDATDVRIETPYIITAKHTNSEEHDTGRLPVSEELESVTLEEAQNIAFEITKQYETGGSYSILAGDFDGAGMSFGSMQWNAKWGTLQKILAKFRAANKATFNKCFENNESALKAIAIFIEEEQVTQKDEDGKRQVPFPNGLEWAKATHNLQKPPYGWKDKWDTYFKNMGEFLDFQKIQKAESISANHPRTLRKIEWLKEKDTSLWKEVTLRSYCALFDLSNQHGSATQAAKTAFEAAIKSKKPSSQLGMVEHFITEVAKHPKTDWIKDSIGRREGILKGEPTGNKDWNKVANPMLKKYLNPDKSIKGL